jgi:hypothetical protein
MFKYLFLIVILTSSENAFSQYLKPADLVGKWINTEGKDARIWDFQNDSIVTFDNGKFLYKLDSVNNEEILLMNHSKNDSAAVWKIKKMDDGRINLIISKVLANDHNSNKLVLMKTSGLDIILKKTN